MQKNFYANPTGKNINSSDCDLEVDDLGYIRPGQPAKQMFSFDGFEPTDEQLAAMNSGITSEKVDQISTNEHNISSILANTDIAEITDTFTIATGFTIDSKSHVFKQGKHIFGRLIIQSSDAYTVTPSIIVSAATYPPKNNITNAAFYDNTSWTCRTLGSYFFGTNGQMSCVCQTGTTDTYAHINLDYVIS